MGSKAYKIEGFEDFKNLYKVTLIELYELYKQKMHVLQDPITNNIHIAENDNLRSIKIGQPMSLSEMDETLTLLRQCKKNYKETKKIIEQPEEEWCGTVEFYID